MESSMSERARKRHDLFDIFGLIVFCLMGAAIGFGLGLVFIKGVAFVATVVMFSILGAIIWLREDRPAGNTFFICGATLLLGWPVAVFFLNWLHQYYNQFTFR